MSDLISVIIPIYKVEKYLNRCVESIVNQTYENLEIILVDDGSPDSCPKMCDEWAKKDKRIKVVHKENGGLADARNAGLNVATGEYIYFADSDDWVENDIVEFLYNLIKRDNYDVSRCGIFIDYEDDEAKNEIVKNDSVKVLDLDDQIIDLMINGYVAGVAWNKLYRRSAIGDLRYSKNDGASEDIMFNYRLISIGVRTIFNDVPKYHYINRENSITNNTFCDGAMSIVRSKKHFLNCEKDNNRTRDYCIKSYFDSLIIVLHGVIKSGSCLNRFDELVSEILKYKWVALSSNLFSLKNKFQVAVIMISPKLYKRMIEGVIHAK